MAKQAPRCTRTYTHWGAWDVEVTDRAIDYLDDKPDAAKPVIAEAAGMTLKESNIVLSLFHFPMRDAQLSERWMGGAVQSFTKEVADFFVKQGQIRLGDPGGPLRRIR